MTEKELQTDTKTAYKFKAATKKWTPLLYYVKTLGAGVFLFKPVEDTLSTKTHSVIQIFLAGPEDLKTAQVYQICLYYGEWEKAPHVCGKDCPLETKSHGQSSRKHLEL